MLITLVSTYTQMLGRWTYYCTYVSDIDLTFSNNAKYRTCNTITQKKAINYAKSHAFFKPSFFAVSQGSTRRRRFALYVLRERGERRERRKEGGRKKEPGYGWSALSILPLLLLSHWWLEKGEREEGEGRTDFGFLYPTTVLYCHSTKEGMKLYMYWYMILAYYVDWCLNDEGERVCFLPINSRNFCFFQMYFDG